MPGGGVACSACGYRAPYPSRLRRHEASCSGSSVIAILECQLRVKDEQLRRLGEISLSTQIAAPAQQCAHCSARGVTRRRVASSEAAASPGARPFGHESVDDILSDKDWAHVRSDPEQMISRLARMVYGWHHNVRCPNVNRNVYAVLVSDRGVMRWESRAKASALQSMYDDTVMRLEDHFDNDVCDDASVEAHRRFLDECQNSANDCGKVYRRQLDAIHAVVLTITQHTACAGTS